VKVTQERGKCQFKTGQWVSECPSKPALKGRGFIRAESGSAQMQVSQGPRPQRNLLIETDLQRRASRRALSNRKASRDRLKAAGWTARTTHLQHIVVFSIPGGKHNMWYCFGEVLCFRILRFSTRVHHSSPGFA